MVSNQFRWWRAGPHRVGFNKLRRSSSGGWEGVEMGQSCFQWKEHPKQRVRSMKKLGTFRKSHGFDKTKEKETKGKRQQLCLLSSYNVPVIGKADKYRTLLKPHNSPWKIPLPFPFDKTEMGAREVSNLPTDTQL